MECKICGVELHQEESLVCKTCYQNIREGHAHLVEPTEEKAPEKFTPAQSRKNVSRRTRS